MIIECNEPFTPEEIDEVFEISVRRTQYYKDPAKTLPNVFKETTKNIIFGAVMMPVLLVLGYIAQFKIGTIVAVTLCAVIILISTLWLVALKKAYKENKAIHSKDPRSKVEYTEEFISVETSNGTTVKIKWTDVAFIKVFNATIGIFSSDKTRALIIPIKHWDPIAKFMEDNNIIVNFYR